MKKFVPIINVHKMLKLGGKAIITVPAHLWLWNKQDRIASHRNRYELYQLRSFFETSGFKVLKRTAFFVSLLPLLYLRTIFDKDGGVVNDADLKGRFEINPFINESLKLLLKTELKLLERASFKWGGSLLAVAEKL